MFTKLQLVICILLAFLPAASQVPGEKQLVEKIATARTDDVRIVSLGELAELYSIYRDNKKADSILEKQLLLAEVSQNEDLILQTIAGSTISNIASWSSKETFDRAMAFLQKTLNYAKDKNNTQLEAIAYLRIASLLRKRNHFDAAMQQVTLAFPLVDRRQDSLKTALYLELGDAFLGKGDAVSAYKNFNTAYDIAYSINNVPLQSATWHRFANLYKEFGDSALSKNALLESLQLNRKYNSRPGQLSDYIDLFRQTDEIEFLNKALSLAIGLRSVRDQLYCKRLMLSYIMVVEKNSAKALAYLENNQDLKLYMANEGLPNYNIGAVYHYSGQYAEAVTFYLKDEPLLLKNFGPSVQLSYFCEVGDCYNALKAIDKAILYYKKAYDISKATGSVTTNATITAKLSQLYSQKNDFKSAFEYSKAYQNFNEDLKTQAKQREVTLLGLEREKRRHEKDLQDLEDKELKKRNLQYMGISMATAFLFIVLLVFGMFPISRTTIRMLNFFSFICLFEFIILLIDNWLHDLTHGEPLKIWLAKIFIIALLLPLHHSLEHIAVKFLSSQKLMKFRRRLSLKKLMHPSKRSVEKLEQDLEESTLI
jgi:tetratricopeptide (TPR) repeat protein